VTKEDIQRVYKRFDGCASEKELVRHKALIEPMVKSMCLDNNLFKVEHQQMKEMIRRFDECISDKANKMSLVELEHRIGENFLK